jgi:hypothetical protein
MLDPRFLLRTSLYPISKRSDKMKLIKKEELCCKCNLGLRRNSSVAHYNSPEKWECHDCWVKPRTREALVTTRFNVINPSRIAAPSTYEKSFGFGAAADSIKGNILNWEYRYWVGMMTTTNPWATCRCCKHKVNGKEARDQHKRLYDPACTVRLVMAYKDLITAKNRICVVCKEPTYRAYYGVPLCTLKCVNSFKFEHNVRYLPIEIALRNNGMNIDHGNPGNAL